MTVLCLHRVDELDVFLLGVGGLDAFVDEFLPGATLGLALFCGVHISLCLGTMSVVWRCVCGGKRRGGIETRGEVGERTYLQVEHAGLFALVDRWVLGSLLEEAVEL